MIRHSGFLPLVSFVALGLGGCDTPRQKAERLLAKLDTDKLRHEAALMSKVLYAGGAPLSPNLKPADWPPSFRPLAPLEVTAYPDGFSLLIERQGLSYSGIYIVPASMDVEPRTRDRAHFERIRDGIYWYTFSP